MGAPGRPHRRQLALVGGADVERGLHAGQLGRAPQIAGHRLEVGEHARHGLGHGLLAAAGVHDENGLHAVARRAPLVLRHVPVGQDVELLAAVQAPGEVLHEALGEGGDAGQLGEVGRRVAGAHLDGAQARGGAHVPAHLGEVLDDAGVDHVPRVGLQLLPGVELVGRARGGQLLEHHRPVVRVARVRPGPEGGGGAQALQVGGAGEQGPQDRQDLGAVLHPDVDVGAEDEHLVAPQPGAVHQPGVALGIGHLLHQGVGEGVGAGAGQVHPQRHGHRQKSVVGQGDVLDALGHGAPGARDELDGVEHHLPVDMGVVAHQGQDLRRALAQVEAVAVHELELPLDAERRARRVGEGQGDAVGGGSERHGDSS